jgi:hypothetical protein
VNKDSDGNLESVVTSIMSCFTATNINEVFSVYQPCQLVKNHHVSGTTSVCHHQDNDIIILMMGSEMITKKLVAFDELKCLMAREDFINDITSVHTLSFRTTHKAFLTIFYLDFIKYLLLLFMSME